MIEAGEPIVFDIGGTIGGYASDMTRMIWVTGGDPARGPDDEFRKLYGVLQDAQAEATGSARPGVACERVDAVARGIIEAGGYGPRFIHRTGHGIGLEVHEEPYLVAGNASRSRPASRSAWSPDLPRGPLRRRIEDIVVCGESGPIVLNEATRDLLVVSG